MSPVFREDELSEYGETVVLRREELRDAVYDTAMTWFDEQNRRPRDPVLEGAAWIAFREACRRAKENK